MTRFLGYELHNGTPLEVWQEVFLEGREGSRPALVFCVNPHSVVEASHDQLFHEALQAADYLLADGVGVTLGARWQSHRVPRITGSDIFECFCRQSQREGQRHFFLGSKQSTLRAIHTRLATDFPGISAVGGYSPPFVREFSRADEDAMVDAVNSAKADILWVGMTAPKQEKWAFRNRQRLQVKCVVAVGAVFDYYAGVVKRPADGWRRLGLEWVPRLMAEPRRLWRRSMISAPAFVWRVLTARRDQ